MALTFTESLALTQIAKGDSSITPGTPGYGAPTRAEVATYDNYSNAHKSIEYNKNYLVFDVFSDSSLSSVNLNKSVGLQANQISLTQEKNSQYVPFSLSRKCDGYDLYNGVIWIVTNAGTKDNEKGTYAVAPINVYATEDTIYFGWLIDEWITRKAGQVLFEIHVHGQVEGREGDEVITRGYVWKSRPSTLTVNQSSFDLDNLLDGTVQQAYNDGWLQKIIHAASENIAFDLIEGQVNNAIAEAKKAKVSADAAEKSATDAASSAAAAASTVNAFDSHVVDLQNQFDAHADEVKAEIPELVEAEITTKVQEITWDEEIPKILGYEYNPIYENGYIVGADITVADYIAQKLENYYTKEEIDTNIVNELQDLSDTFNTTVGELKVVNNDGAELVSTTVAGLIQEVVSNVDVTSQLNELSQEVSETYATKTEVSNKIGNLGQREDDEGNLVDIETVAEAIANVDVTSQLDTLSQEISETYATKADLGNVKVDLTGYATEKYVTNITDPLTISINEMKDTVDKVDTSPRKTYVVEYDNTEDENVGENMFVLYEIENENTENEVKTVKRRFEITGGGSGGTLNKLYIYYDTNAAGADIPSYVFTKDNQADNAAIIYYRFYGVDPTDQEIAYGNATWKMRKGTSGSWQTLKTETIYPGDKRSFNVSEYLDNVGTYQVQLEVVDDTTAKAIKTWTVQFIELKITSSFNDKITQPLGPVRFEYTPYGAVSKDIHFVLDGEEIPGSPVTVTSYNNGLAQMLPAQEHGSHLLEVYMTAKVQDVVVESNHIFKDILWYDENNSKPVIGCAYQDFETRQYDTTNIEYTVYDPKTGTPSVQIFVDDKLVSTQILTEATNTYSFKTDVVGEHEIKIVCGDTVKTLKANVTKINIDLSVENMPTPVFDFNPSGKSNSDIDRLWSQGNIHMTVSDNFDWINGGYQIDEKGDQYFCIKAGTSAEIDYKLFGDEAKRTGKEFKLIFKTTNVAKSNATFLSCIDSVTGSDNIGVQMDVHEAFIYSQAGKLHLPYSEEDIIEFEFNIAKDSEGSIPMVMGYEDGVSTCPMVYDENHGFVQDKPKPISLGSPYCDLHIYRFKVYDTELSDVNILNNFILDARSAEEMIARYDRNQIKDDNGILDPDILMKKCPWLRIIQIEAPHFTNGKKYPINNTTIQYTYPAGKDLGLKDWKWKATDCVHVGQGTSSDNYGAAGRNMDLVLKTHKDYNNSPVITLEDGSVVSKVALTSDSVATNYFNIKVNIASSENANNALLQRRYNEFNPYNRAFVRDSEAEIAKIKDTMEFHNCVVFIRETDPDISSHTEFGDNEWHFYAIGNIGDSKKTDKTRLTDPSDPYECIVELMDVKLPLSDFPKDTMMSAMGYTIDEVTKEKKYTWAKDENLDILYEKVGDTYVKTADTTVNLEKTYYVDILEHDDFSEDYTYGWRYLFEYDEGDVEDVDAANQEIFDYCKSKWIELYRFVTTSSDALFEKNFGDYFVLDSALYYYLFTTRYTMVDNRAKNTFWHYGKTGEVDAEGNPIRKWDLCFDYDNDTALGINNYGAMVYRYGLEDTHVDEDGVEIFREADSTFFCRVRDRFSTQLKKMYNDLETLGAWRAESSVETSENTGGSSMKSKGLINQFDEWQSEFPEELWRLDIERKYLRTYSSSHVNGKGDPQFLVDMAHGKKKYQRRQYERGQEKYMASKYQSSVASSDQNSIVIRCGSLPAGKPVVTPNYSLTLVPYDYMYLNVEYKTGVVQVPVTEPGKPVTVPFSGTDTDIIKIYSGYSIESLGDLSPIYPRTIAAGVASKLKELNVGNSTPGYNNPFLTTLTTSDANRLLEKINIENVTGFDEKSVSLNLSALKNLKELYARGSNITGVTFANGGRIEIAELPTLNSITMKNLAYLTRFDVVDLSKLTSLTVENCNTIDLLDVLEKATSLNWVRLINVDWTEENALENTELLERLYNLKGYDKDNYVVDRCVLTGKVYVLNIKQSEYEKYINEQDGWGSDLIIEYPESGWTPQFPVTFKNYLNDTDVETIEYWVDQFGHPTPPTETPTKPDSLESTFVFKGWAKATNLSSIITDWEKEIVDGPLAYVAVYSSEPRQYTVTYMAKINGQQIMEPKTYTAAYGSTVEYDGEIPTYTVNERNGYFYLFKGWDQSGYVNGDKDIYAEFDSFKYERGAFDAFTNPDDPNGGIIKYMRPVELYALTRLVELGLLYCNGESIYDNPNMDSDSKLNIDVGDDFNFTMGYDLDYTDVQSQVIISEKTSFNGSRQYKTDVKLFDQDKDFTLAIDYNISSSLANGTLIQCLKNGTGFAVSLDGTTPIFSYNGLADSVLKHQANSREMIVIRHVAGESSLHVYSSNMGENNIIKKTINVNLTQTDASLIFGSGTDYDGSGMTNPAIGDIYWSKIWYADLGNEICEKLVGWTHEEVKLDLCGFKRYYGTDNKMILLNFLGAYVLDTKMPYDGKNTGSAPWANAALNRFLNTRFYNAVPDQMKALMKNAVVGSVTGQDNNTIIKSNCYVWIPSVCDVDNSEKFKDYKDEVYNRMSAISYMSSKDKRIRTHTDGTVSDYWLRTPQLTEVYQYHVDSNGDRGTSNKPNETYAGEIYSFRTSTTKMGVLIEIGI